MKNKNLKWLITAFVSLFLACICLASVFAFPIKASAAKSNSYKTDYKTTDKKPTYTETLNKNNKLLEGLSKKENKALKKAKDNSLNWVDDSLALVISASSSSETDWEKVGTEITKGLVTAIVGIWGLDGIVGAIFEGIESLTSSGEAPLSEVLVLSDDIDKRFNEMSDKLYDIEEQLGALSNQVTTSVNDVLSGKKDEF